MTLPFCWQPWPNLVSLGPRPKDAYLPACDKHMPLPCDDGLHQHTTYHISLSLLLSYQTYPKAARLASLLPPSPLHTPLRIRGTAESQAADHVSCAAMPARKRDTRLVASGFRPPRLRYLYTYITNIYIYIYIYISVAFLMYSPPTQRFNVTPLVNCRGLWIIFADHVQQNECHAHA